MNATTEVIDELRRVMAERDEARADAQRWRKSREERNDEANNIQRALNRAARERDELQDTIDAITNALGIENAQHAIDAIETLKKERDEARDGKIREIRHDWTAMLEDRAQAWKERDEAREELAGLRADLATVTLERDEARRERNTWQRASEHRSDEIETLEEKLHAETLTRIAVARAWREAVAEVAEVLARTAAEKRCSS